MPFKKIGIVILAAIVTSHVLLRCETSQKAGYSMQQIKERLADFAETHITYDQTLLDDRQIQVIDNLSKAAVIMDSLFLDQVYSKNQQIKAELEAWKTEKGKATLALFNIMFGPFDRLEHNQPFYGHAVKPSGANYYPEDMTKDEFNQWIELHPDDREMFTSEYTMIRRRNGELVAIPYAEYFRGELTQAADYLRQAARYADNQSLRRYLQTRADAFLSNDYYASDMAWMELEDHTIEVVIGPYEVYEDQLFNYKAAFECFITLRDPHESDKVERFASYLVDMERNLPIPEQYKNFDRGLESPIIVAQEVFSAGDTKAGVQTLAFNLPNDERVRQARGSKKVLLKNVNEAKFSKLLQPIASRILAPEQHSFVSFEAFFNHVLMHEISHGIGPGYITVNGRKTEVRDELKETYSTIEECKADALGMYNTMFMVEQGEFPESFENHVWSTFLAGIFRSVRFGINEAHGAGNAIIFNYLLEHDAYRYNEDAQTVRVNFDTIYGELESLIHTILMIQATGDYQGAKELIAQYGIMSPSIGTLVGTLDDLPVDIKPVYEIQERLSE